ncbi:MAG: ATP-binding cassette domain-containing protein [Propionibacteriaceae bacterium]|jgi:ATPase subunit of ABC transporter with duplicated ATPase domains|nr:ATP-binding cassette domain-containing protein [Propionibacteriaceae bacterium]
MSFPITFDHLSFHWPDGDIGLDDVSGSFGAGRTGLVGDNGSGKTTFLRLIAGQLVPSSGRLEVAGEVSYLPQTIALARGATVADLLGVRAKLDALRAIEQGSVDPGPFDLVGDDWDIETQADQLLRGLDTAGGGLAGADLDRDVTRLSGGEAMVMAIAGCQLRRTAVTLLDEPTNNLDAVLRQQVLQLIAAWGGTVVVASHDVGLLDLMDATAELHDGRLALFGGGYSAWRAALAVEQAAAAQAEQTAEQALRTARRQRAAALEKTAKNLARGKAKAIGEGLGKAARDSMRNRAEATAGRARGTGDDRVERARAALAEASLRRRGQEHIRLDLPDPGVPAGRRLLELTWGDDERFVLRGPERVALLGRNGVGKTTLVEELLGLRPPSGDRTAPDQTGGEVVPDPAGVGVESDTTEGRATPDRGKSLSAPDQAEDRATPDQTGGGAPDSGDGRLRGRLLTDRVGYLPQRLDGLDDARSALDNVAAVALAATAGEIRTRLARLLLRGEAAFRPVADLSGGERFRVALARLLFAQPPAQLLILDEPTNNLDLTSLDQLVEALSGYRGAILIISHNLSFIERLGVDVALELADGRIERLRLPFVDPFIPIRP